MARTDPVGAYVDARVHFLSGSTKAPANEGHVIVPTQDLLKNQSRAIENAVGTRLPGEERSAPESIVSGSRPRSSARSVLARKRGKLRRTA